MNFYIVDAFTEELFGGNPAGVVMVEGGEFPSFDIMRKTAAELRYSESAFVKKISDDVWEIRFFTPTDEVDLCGHATIAAFSIISKKFGQNKTYKAITKAGEIEVKVEGSLILMDMATPVLLEEIKEELKWEAMRKILGFENEAYFKTGEFSGLTPAKVSTGLPDIIFPVDSTEELEAIAPDFDSMSRLSERQEVVGIHVYALTKDGNDLKIDCRNFAPLYGIPEEAATGTSNGALTYYLYKKGIINENEQNIIIQGASMGRPWKIITIATSDKNGNTLIKVGGTAVTLAEGEINI